MKRADFPEPVKALVGELKRLPGIGPRSAERIAVWLLQSPKANPAPLAEVLLVAKDAVRPCPVCGFFATEAGCEVCDDPARDDSILCVVEQATDVLPLSHRRIAPQHRRLIDVRHVHRDVLRVRSEERRVGKECA